MAEETVEIVKKARWWVKLLKFCVKYPVNTLFTVASGYFASQAYLFDQTVTMKVAFFAILGLWVFWFLAKQIFVLLIMLGLIGGGAYLYYEYQHREIKKCEESGGYWNKETKTCEEEVPLLEQAKRYLKKMINEFQHEDKKEKTKND